MKLLIKELKKTTESKNEKVLRNYRIEKDQDAKIKSASKRLGVSDSEIVRAALKIVFG